MKNSVEVEEMGVGWMEMGGEEASISLGYENSRKQNRAEKTKAEENRKA